MLNLTEKQVDDFKDWKQDYLEKIDLMREVIKTSDPKEYAENSFYNILGEISVIVDEFEVETDRAYYKVGTTEERVFGFFLKECVVEIDCRIAEFEMDKVLKDVFSEKSANLCRIFGI